MACADVAPPGPQKSRHRQGIPEVRTLDELLAHPEVERGREPDAAARLTRRHRAVLEAGKAAFSEKPLGVDLAEAQALVDLAAPAGCDSAVRPTRSSAPACRPAARGHRPRATSASRSAANAFMLRPGPGEGGTRTPRSSTARAPGRCSTWGPYYLTALVQLLGPRASAVSGESTSRRAKRTIHSEPRQRRADRRGGSDARGGLVESRRAPIATLVTSFDVQPAVTATSRSTATEATLSVPDPNTFDGPVMIRRQRRRGVDRDRAAARHICRSSAGSGWPTWLWASAAATRTGRRRPGAARARADDRPGRSPRPTRAAPSTSGRPARASRCRPVWPPNTFDD